MDEMMDSGLGGQRLQGDRWSSNADTGLLTTFTRLVIELNTVWRVYQDELQWILQQLAQSGVA